jgi:hypothetical protein
MRTPPPAQRASAELEKAATAITIAQKVVAIFSIALLPYCLVFVRVVQRDTWRDLSFRERVKKLDLGPTNIKFDTAEHSLGAKVCFWVKSRQMQRNSHVG